MVRDVFAFFPDERYNDQPEFFTCYAHLGQHSACHIDYAKECEEAQYNEYHPLLIELIGQGYKDLNVLNAQTTEAHRPPTDREIKFGEGATHWLTVRIGSILKKNGKIKHWFINPVDGLRYSTR